jgi:hypothetical protein
VLVKWSPGAFSFQMVITGRGAAHHGGSWGVQRFA